ncbi:MAG: uncharacterized protein JWM80_1767 [Cyanobacteria bacterium RYN_339]|nr:uncharacterized protein [Cyanobacteria bacterium RYN_339]
MFPNLTPRLLPAVAASLALLAGCQSPTATTPVQAPGDLAPAQAAPADDAAAPDVEPTRRLTTISTVVGSATTGTYVAARAVDGDTNTEWQAPGSPAPTLTLDRGAPGSLTAVAIKAKPAQPFAIQVSDDGTTYKTVGAAAANTTWNLETRSLPTGTNGRYVRLAYNAQSAGVMVFELQPQGTLAAPSAAPSVAPTTAPTAVPTVAPTVAPTAAPVSGAVATRFGNQSVPRSADGTHTRGYALMQELGMNTIREGFNWKNIEIGDRQYVTWMSYFDDKVAKFAAMGVKVQAMITDTPAWASTDGTAGGVPKGLASAIFADGTDVYKPGVGPNTANKFATYMFDMVTRYKGRIGAWELWNEPDYPSGDLGAGATGTSNGAPRYWHGTVQEYVRLLKVGSTVVRGIDASARVTLGGLGYEGYLDAVLANGGAAYFDVVDFHAYGTDKTSSNGVLNSAWGFLGRYNAMKAKMTARNVTGKTWSCSETGFTSTNQPEQANYVAKVFATGLGLGDVEMVQWAVFTNPGFNSIGIIDNATMSVKTQGYTAFTQATKQLTGATPVGAVTGAGLQGYRFRRADGKSLAVVWSSGTGNAALTAPFPVTQALNVQGAAIATPTSVGVAPVYLVGN